MTEDKMRRMVTGVVVAATALIATLLIILVSQIVTMCVQNSKFQALAEDRVRYEQSIAECKKDAEYYRSELGIQELLHYYRYE